MPGARPHPPADQPQAAAGGRIQRQQGMHQQAMDVAVANLAQATPAPLGRAEMNRAGILDRQNMPACRRTSGLFAPTVRQRRNRHVRIGEKPAIADELRAAPTGQPAHAYRGMRNHTFQQRSPPFIAAAIPEPANRPRHLLQGDILHSAPPGCLNAVHGSIPLRASGSLPSAGADLARPDVCIP